MSRDDRAFQKELDEWKRSLHVPTGGRKARAAKDVRDSIRAFTFGFRDWLEQSMRPQGMTVAQLRMLFAIRHESAASSARIARLCQVTPQTMQAMLQRAVREGWLVRHPAEHNARVLVGALTPKGNALLDQAVAATSTFELQVWRDATTQDLQAIHAAFQGALKRMEEANAVQAATPLRKRAAAPKRTSGRTTKD